MAAVSRLQSLTNRASLQNLIHRHLLRPAATPAAASAAEPFNIFPQFQPSVHFDSQNSKSILTGRFSDNNELSFSNDDKFLLNRNFVSALRTFDLSLMELRGSRSTSSKKLPDPEEDDEDDYEDDFDDDDDDELKDFDDVYGRCDDSDESDDDDFGHRGHGGGRGGGSRGGGAYTV